jgi:hypothetical protein
MLASLLFATGCSGIRAQRSVSPLDFFMPGIGSFMKAEPKPEPSLFISADGAPLLTQAN